VTRGRTDDAIRVTRNDGSEADTHFPKKGPFPHDLVHAVVEDTPGRRGTLQTEWQSLPTCGTLSRHWAG